MKNKKLTREMHEALDLVKQKGKIVRYRGGLWAQENSPMRTVTSVDGDYTVPKRWFFTTTIEALARRGLIEPSYWKNLNSGMFVVEYIPTKLAYEQADKNS